ncbi:recombinase family protein [Nocardioides sp. zg-DK7169]|uniref:recombinase family protein n=1 Tax=Nocardioides sp. zg-DK7169 TaxID=2736600 RepID=UPI00155804B7|nr:recombinase family protein [Nocardioides sp. zg-DK7169]NPC97881.1 recombinase family protein [Nocardioides sp. zg-DK7169]
MPATARRCAIYVRISVAQEASVSIDRQVEAAEQYAAARGWQVVATFRDEGVSATHNKPEDRAGWRALLDSPESFDAVVIWKLDRLARRVLDFHLANEALQQRGAGIVAVENAIDMTTPDGRFVAGVLATFAEYEADAISARVKAARNHLLKAGRVVGGTVPYGWRSVPNPDGNGYVLAKDPDRIDFVRGAAERVAAGASIYSTVQWLNEVGAPLPGVSQASRKRDGWAYSTVERLLRNPVLAGMTAYNPGNVSKQRGTEVLRDPDTGLPVVDESVAIMTPPEWRAMVQKLDARNTAQSKPRAMRAKTSGLLSGLVYCGEHDGEAVRMHRGTVQNRPGYYCPSCHMAISNFEDAVVEEFLRQRGDQLRLSVVEEVHEGGAALLPEIEHRLAELGAALQATDDDDEADRLTAEIAGLRKLRREARAKAPRVTLRAVEGSQTFGEDWAQAGTVETRRAVLDDALRRVWVRRGRPGRRTPAQLLARLTFDWHPAGQVEAPTDEDLAYWAD